MDKNRGTSRIVALDLLRAISVLVVFLFHAAMHQGCDFGMLKPFIKMGAIFMTAFFILSGYCSFSGYRTHDLGNIKEILFFYKKRAIAILPLYYVVAVLYIIFLGKESMGENFILAPIEVLCIQTVFNGSFQLSHNGGTWFLSCLVLCYLFYPFM